MNSRRSSLDPSHVTSLAPTRRSTAEDHRNAKGSAEPTRVSDDSPSPTKHRRRCTTTPKALPAAAPARTLTLNHTPPAHAPDDEATRILGEWITQHRGFLLGTQAGALAGVTAGAAGATAGFMANLGGMGPFGPVCNTVALVLSCIDIYQTQVSADQAREHYLAWHVALAEQRQLRADIDERARSGLSRPDDPSLLELIDTLTEQLEAFTRSYEEAFFKHAQGAHVRRAHESLQAQAKALVALKAEYDRCGEEMLRLKAQLHRPGFADDPARPGIVRGIERLERQRAGLEANAPVVRKAMRKRLSVGQMRRDVKERLAQATAELKDANDWEKLRLREPDPEGRILGFEIELQYAKTEKERNRIAPLLTQARLDLQKKQAIESLQQEVQDLKKALGHLSRRPDKVLLNPFGDRGPDQLAHLSGVVLSTAKNVIDFGATVNTASVVWHLVQPVVSSMPILMPAWLLGLFTGRIDVIRGKQAMKAATAAKESLRHKAAHAAQLLPVYRQDGVESEVKRVDLLMCQLPVQALLHGTSQQLRYQHQASVFGKARKASGLKDIVTGICLIVTGAVTLVTGVPVVVPFAIVAGSSGTAYAGTATHYVFCRRKEEHDRQQQEAAALAFVRLYGEAGLTEFYRDVAQGHASRWDKRLDALRQQMRATPDGRDLDPRVLHPQALASSPWLAIEYLGHALYVRARDRGIGSPSVESELVSRLATTLGTPDPSTWTLDSFASPDLYRQQVREALCQVYGAQQDPVDQLPFQTPRDVSHIAARANFWIKRHCKHRNALSEDGALTLRHWMDAVTQDPQTFGDRLAKLAPEERQRLRDHLAFLGQRMREEGIGPRELFALQALSVQPVDKDGGHPLKDFPLLTSPQAPYLLELIADPSWLDDPAATAPPPALPAPTPGARAVGQLIDAFKSVGREMRDGPKAAPTQPPVGNGEVTAPAHRRFQRWVQRRPHATAKHFRQQMPNPLATPAKVLERLDQLEKKAAVHHDDTQLMSFLEKLLVAFAEAGESPELEPAQGKAPVDARTDDASQDTARKRAELASRLQSAADSAAAAAAGLAVKGKDRAIHAKGRQQLTKQMEQTAVVCQRLKRHVAHPSDDPRWAAMLAPIPMKPAAATAA